MHDLGLINDKNTSVNPDSLFLGPLVKIMSHLQVSKKKKGHLFPNHDPPEGLQNSTCCALLYINTFHMHKTKVLNPVDLK